MNAGGQPGDPAAGGFAKTPEGYVHRPRLGVCPDLLATLPPPTLPSAVDGGLPAPLNECTKHSDCSQHPHGSCIVAYVYTGPIPGTVLATPYFACSYGCARDEDCSSGTICLCGSTIGTCVSASCTTDAECGSKLCSEFIYQPASGCGYGDGSAQYYFKCATPGVECATNADCDTEHFCAGSECHNSLAC